ncbi:DNA topoisomerase IV subunit A [Dongia mobilis]|uniref:DNA topoisomerase 4 subunit A n=1 Tax=Dongia mobilis TaxID=578943 RepID=A0A4R6WUE5_9PROT|nr:DNA topoisomerase IV subunit A [Dongia mobilis]TDQ82540.1 DNA topoisomerase IV subunit A [Dongia mobilis]
MAKKAAQTPPPEGEIKLTNLAEALGERYLSYALSTIMARSLPDVRDGLKPVHRRILYTMRQLRLDPGSGFKKSARVVGDVMGKYHPHGDSSIYDAMVRLAQEFAVRYPMVEGQGNFGSIDGDNPAAMRYTEARLTGAAALMLQDLDNDTVDFRASYDGENLEPVILPAAFPNLLANGAQGIAVGMATSIPPHNVAEICDCLAHLLKSPNARIETLMNYLPGPDFPTGGIICETRESLLETYRTGRGSIRIRARWNVEQLKGGGYQIVVTEIPYQVAKSKLIEKIAELLLDKKLPFLDDINDESTTDIRLVLTPKSRNVEPEHLMEQLFRLTDLETRFGLNMNVLDANQVPRVMSLPEVLQAYLDHRRVVLQRRTRHRLSEIERRLEILEGYLIVYLNIDEVIRIIRFEDEPKAVMMKKWKLSDIQAEAILNMRLKSLRKLEEVEIRREHKELSAERKDLQGLLASEDKQWAAIGGEVQELKKAYGPKTELGRRRTEMGDAPSAIVIPMEAMVEREPITVICSSKGWIRAMKGHVEPGAEIKFKEGDWGKFQLHAETTDKLVIFCTNGKFYTIPCDKLPGGRGHGEPVRLYIDLGNEHDIVAMMIHKPGAKLLVASHDGRGFVVGMDDVVAQTKNGKQVLTVPEGEEASICVPAEGDMLAVIGENRKLLIFKLSEVPEMTRGRGVMLQKYKDGGISDAKVYARAEGLTWRLGDKTRTESHGNLKDWIGERAQAGRLPPTGFPKANKFSG